MRADWTQRQSGVWFTVPSMRLHRIACCDCGLCHDVSFRIVRGKLQIKAYVNGPATGGKRKKSGAWPPKQKDAK